MSGTDVASATELDPAAADQHAAQQLSDIVGQLVRMLRRAHVAPLGPSATSALATVVRDGPTRLGELAEREGVTPATLSRVVAVLERAGFVERRADPKDRRAAFLAATPAGADNIAQLRASRATVLVRRMAELTPQQRADLAAGIAVLERLL